LHQVQRDVRLVNKQAYIITYISILCLSVPCKSYIYYAYIIIIIIITLTTTTTIIITLCFVDRHGSAYICASAVLILLSGWHIVQDLVTVTFSRLTHFAHVIPSY